jgi:hypothetical protein
MAKSIYPRSWGKLFERYCKKYLPDRKKEICLRANQEYQKLLKQMPDVGGKSNPMADTIGIWFTMVAFYEASDHVIDGKAFQIIHGWHVDKLRFLGKIIDANKSQLPFRLFEAVYKRYEKNLQKHRARGEWKDSWDIEMNPKGHQSGVSFDLIGCPIAIHAKQNGYEELLPFICATDHSLAHVMHAKLIRHNTKILGGNRCDYWYVGDRSKDAEKYAGLKEI